MTLVILALASLTLAGISRQNLRDSLMLGDDSRELQRRWAIFSCQNTFLSDAQAVVRRQAAATQNSTTTVRIQLVLGGEKIDLVFADEQAKVNLNTLDHIRGRAEVDRFVRSAARSAGASADIHLRPLHRYGDQTSDSIPTIFGSFGQVFASRYTLDEIEIWLASTQRMTCWGNGRLNYREAEAGDIAALNPLNIHSKNGKKLDKFFTDTSSCFSLWIILNSGERPEARFAVQEFGDDGRSHLTCISF